MGVSRLKHNPACDIVAEGFGVQWYSAETTPQACLVCDFAEKLSPEEVLDWHVYVQASRTKEEFFARTAETFNEWRLAQGLTPALQPW